MEGRGLIVDLFAGGGGASTGLEAATAAETLEAQTALIGNSVPPEVVEALALANIDPERARAAA